MSTLHNRISRRELKERLLADPTPRTTLSFYCYFFIEDPQQFRNQFYHSLSLLGVLGRIYVATEGVNAQISIPTASLTELRNYLDTIEPLKECRLNKAVGDDGKSFFVLDIKVRKKIVSDGIEDPSFDMRKKGKYVSPADFNRLAMDPSTIIVDMRNYYEYEVGHFKNAMEVPSNTFREQLPMAASLLKEKKETTILMYCTGGIRCEKASAYMLHQGFQHVFHLEGGVINYAQKVKEGSLPSLFIGKNFVFDERLGERITSDIIANCHQCGQPADIHTNCKNDGCHLLFIQCESCARVMDGCCSDDCLQTLSLTPDQRKSKRKGKDLGQHIFNKSRDRLKKLSTKKSMSSR